MFNFLLVFRNKNTFEGKIQLELILNHFHHVYHFSSILFINIIYRKISHPFFPAGTILSAKHSAPYSM